MRIRKLRNELGLTQEELGAKIGQTKSNISKYETGALEPSLQALGLLSDIFDVTIDYLVGKTDIRKQALPAEKDYCELVSSFDSLSEESKKELEKYVHLLKMKDQMDKGKDELSSALEKEA